MIRLSNKVVFFSILLILASTISFMLSGCVQQPYLYENPSANQDIDIDNISIPDNSIYAISGYNIEYADDDNDIKIDTNMRINDFGNVVDIDYKFDSENEEIDSQMSYDFNGFGIPTKISFDSDEDIEKVVYNNLVTTEEMKSGYVVQYTKLLQNKEKTSNDIVIPSTIEQDYFLNDDGEIQQYLTTAYYSDSSYKQNSFTYDDNNRLIQIDLYSVSDNSNNKNKQEQKTQSFSLDYDTEKDSLDIRDISNDKKNITFEIEYDKNNNISKLSSDNLTITFEYKEIEEPNVGGYLTSLSDIANQISFWNDFFAVFEN